MSRKKPIKELIDRLNESVEKKITVDEFHEQLVPHAVSTIMKVKKVKAKIHPDFGPSLSVCIKSIWSYRRLCADVEDMRKISFDSDNFDHENKLLKLWRLLMPESPLECRISKQWQDIGFQGDNPSTDFRGMSIDLLRFRWKCQKMNSSHDFSSSLGMGLLGLENLLYFAEEYNGAARYVLSHSAHPVHGYTFAIVGINLTSMAYNLLQNGAAKTHLFNLKAQYLGLKHFHRLYCYLFFEFDKFWLECKPTSLMDFSNIHARFLSYILEQLNDDQTLFNINQVFNI